MKSGAPGKSTSEVKVTNISWHGFWILAGEEELFLPFQDFPWFEAAPVASILRVELQGPDHLYWADLDIDLSMESIRHPEEYPLVSKSIPDTASH